MMIERADVIITIKYRKVLNALSICIFAFDLCPL